MRVGGEPSRVTLLVQRDLALGSSARVPIGRVVELSRDGGGVGAEVRVVLGRGGGRVGWGRRERGGSV